MQWQIAVFLSRYWHECNSWKCQTVVSWTSSSYHRQISEALFVDYSNAVMH